ncbi:DnaJ-like protein [Formosa agariphila KMM 3901]|uniref:DnaJ-like protein n=1 Tax=Formosa agariphila (strain DSM 15362 / KCTC 12365 / LMG 23005 / KMM 3901 / M-2Alg 35-1) TaxID=1347342 RepID=T2KGC6_FORAG|nr:TerB family tellurite resistance protein [Formosa agariphila]CDF77795.1 DnaJ-like protein [Formosa agariphila KMM 3901]
MSVSKWLGATLGWSFGGPIGAILGFALGSVVDGLSNGGIKVNTQGPFSSPSQSRTRSGDFEVSLLVLAAIVIKADGRSDQRELDYVRAQFVGMYGKDRANQAFKLFKNISQQENIPVRDVCLQIKQMMDHPSRLQLLHFLFGIAKADGNVSKSEVDIIYTISNYLGIRAIDFESIKAMFYSSSDNAYKILEIDKSATNDEIKKAYRNMAKKYHPDKVIHLGPEHQKGAEEKFRQVKDAYDQLQKERGFN